MTYPTKATLNDNKKIKLMMQIQINIIDIQEFLAAALNRSYLIAKTASLGRLYQNLAVKQVKH